MRCRSWRPVPDVHVGDGHKPGKCRDCWRPCFKKVEHEGDVRCEGCYDALDVHPDEEIRRALAGEPDLPERHAQVLLSDPEATVRGAAQWHFEHRFPLRRAEAFTTDDVDDEGWPST